MGIETETMRRVYNTIVGDFVLSRELTIEGHDVPHVDEAGKILEKTEFYDSLAEIGYVCIHCHSKRRDRNVYIYLLEEGSTLIKKSADLVKLIKRTPGYKAGEPMEIIIVAYTYDGKKVNTLEKMSSEQIDIRIVPYVTMVANPMKHMYSSLHTIMTQEEIDDLVNHTYHDEGDFAKIHEDDVCAFWVGAKRGEMLKIDGYTEAGIDPQYRFVVAPMR